jgi:putative transposase
MTDRIERIRSHLERVVRGTLEETLNALLDAKADRLCNVISPC